MDRVSESIARIPVGGGSFDRSYSEASLFSARGQATCRQLWTLSGDGAHGHTLSANADLLSCEGNVFSAALYSNTPVYSWRRGWHVQFIRDTKLKRNSPYQHMCPTVYQQSSKEVINPLVLFQHHSARFSRSSRCCKYTHPAFAPN